MKHEHQRSFLKILTDSVSELEPDQQAEELVRRLANMKVSQYIFGGLYNVLVRDKELKSFSEMPKDYQDELWELAEKYMPNKDCETQLKYCYCIMVMLWLMNN